MKETNWDKKKLERFCEDNFLDDDIADKLQVFMKGQKGTLEVIQKGDELEIADLKIDIVLNSV